MKARTAFILLVVALAAMAVIAWTSSQSCPVDPAFAGDQLQGVIVCNQP